jgi:hypothetical protein
VTELRDGKLCPLLVPTFGSCVEDKCAWWLRGSDLPWEIPGMCSIQALGRACVKVGDYFAMQTHPIITVRKEDIGHTSEETT